MRREIDPAPVSRGCALAVLTTPLVIAVLLLADTVIGAPPEHDVHVSGGRPLTYTATMNPTLVFGAIPPTTSLADARCAAWHQRNAAQRCPSDAELSRQFWPDLQQTPAAIYVGVLSTCQTTPQHLNIDWSDAAITLHCHTTGRFVNISRGVFGVTATISAEMVTIDVQGMKPGTYSVYREDRVEKWVMDQVSTSLLGSVTMS